MEKKKCAIIGLIILFIAVTLIISVIVVYKCFFELKGYPIPESYPMDGWVNYSDLEFHYDMDQLKKSIYGVQAYLYGNPSADWETVYEKIGLSNNKRENNLLNYATSGYRNIRTLNDPYGKFSMTLEGHKENPDFQSYPYSDEEIIQIAKNILAATGFDDEKRLYQASVAVRSGQSVIDGEWSEPKIDHKSVLFFGKTPDGLKNLSVIFDLGFDEEGKLDDFCTQDYHFTTKIKADLISMEEAIDRIKAGDSLRAVLLDTDQKCTDCVIKSVEIAYLRTWNDAAENENERNKPMLQPVYVFEVVFSNGEEEFPSSLMIQANRI